MGLIRNVLYVQSTVTLKLVLGLDSPSLLIKLSNNCRLLPFTSNNIFSEKLYECCLKERLCKTTQTPSHHNEFPASDGKCPVEFSGKAC